MIIYRVKFTICDKRISYDRVCEASISMCSGGSMSWHWLVVLAATVGLVTLRSWKAATENSADVVKLN